MSGQTEQWEQWVGSHSRPVQRIKRHVKVETRDWRTCITYPDESMAPRSSSRCRTTPTKSCDQGHHDDCPHRLGGPKRAAA